MNPQENEEAIDLAEYYQIILRHKTLILSSLLIMTAMILFYNVIATPIYQGSATLIVDKETPKPLISGERADYESSQSESLTFFSHFELITSRPVLEEVIKTLKLTETGMDIHDQSFQISPFQKLLSNWKKNLDLFLNQLFRDDKDNAENQDLLINEIFKRLKKEVITIKHIEDTRLVKIDALTASPSLSADIANGVAQAYIDYNIGNRLKSSQNTVTYLTNSLYEIKKNLEDAEKEFLAYKQREKLISMEESQRVTVQKITELTNSYVEVRNRRFELDSKLAKINEALKAEKGIPNLRSLIGNEIINNLYAQLVNLEVELSRSEKVFLPKHPNIIQAQTQISNVRNKLNAEINKELNNIKAERSVLLAKEQVLHETVNDYKNESLEINKKEFQYNILKRNVEMNQKLYDVLLARLKEADMTGNFDISSIRIAEKAVIPAKPIKPKKMQNLILGVVFGLIIGIGFSFLLEYLDRSISTEEDAKKYLGVPILSYIPIINISKEFQEKIKKEQIRHENREQ